MEKHSKTHRNLIRNLKEYEQDHLPTLVIADVGGGNDEGGVECLRDKRQEHVHHNRL